MLLYQIFQLELLFFPASVHSYKDVDTGFEQVFELSERGKEVQEDYDSFFQDYIVFDCQALKSRDDCFKDDSA